MITKLEKKTRGRNKLDSESTHLKNFIQNNWIIDMPFNNGIYTWNNRRDGTQHIASCLHKVFHSENGVHLGGDLSTSILPLSGSDHWPISLQWKRPRNNTQRPFPFETFWLMHPDLCDMVQSNWKIFSP